jgi:hypothetical protein
MSQEEQEYCTATIKIKPTTRERLANLGTKRESYDVILTKLIDHYHNFTIKPGGKKR